MRIYPTQLSRNFVNNNKKNVHKNDNAQQLYPQNTFEHKYTGVASVDLAYASMFDKAIAKDLKLMGLI